MSNQDRLTIIIRIIGLYFLWQTVQTLLSAVLIGFILPNPAPSKGFLDIFSRKDIQSLFLLQSSISMVTVQGLFSFSFLLYARKIAQWILKDIKESSISQTSLNKNEIINTTIQVVGILWFTFTARDFVKFLPSLFTTVEQPFSSPIFIMYVVQICISIFLIMRSYLMTSFLQRFSK